MRPPNDLDVLFIADLFPYVELPVGFDLEDESDSGRKEYGQKNANRLKEKTHLPSLSNLVSRNEAGQEEDYA